MPRELPGFYYDAEKNRYFPYKGPIPGSSSKPPTAKAKPDESQRPCIKMSQGKLLQARELCGNKISCRKDKLSFQAEYQKTQASKPLIWKYNGTEKMANIAMQHVVANVTTPQGVVGRDILLTGGANGLLWFLQIGEAGQETNRGHFNYKEDHIWPLNFDQTAGHKQLVRRLGSSPGAQLTLTSEITCIKACTKHDDIMSKISVITTMGSGSSPGCVYILDLSKPLTFDGYTPIVGDGLKEVASYKHTIWTADCDSKGSHAVLGTDGGVALMNIETGASSVVYRCKSSAVKSLQLDQSGNFVICGLRNGNIVNADIRQKQINRNTNTSSTLKMPSSVCCLKLLICNRYFLASSMDGTIKLYDNRMIHREAVQSYEGNINSHSPIQLEVDPSENVLMTGGEDHFLRLWDIMSGKLIFKERFMNSTPLAVCWPRNKGILSSWEDSDQDYRGYWQDHCSGAWLGSDEGIFYMDWL